MDLLGFEADDELLMLFAFKKFSMRNDMQFGQECAKICMYAAWGRRKENVKTIHRCKL